MEGERSFVGGAASVPVSVNGASHTNPTQNQNAILEDSSEASENGPVRSGLGDWASFPIGHVADNENRLQRAAWPNAKVSSATSNYLHQMLSTFSKNTKARRGLPLQDDGPEPDTPRAAPQPHPQPQEVAAECEIYEDSASESGADESLAKAPDNDPQAQNPNSKGGGESERRTAFDSESESDSECIRPLQTPLVYKRPTATARRVLGLVSSVHTSARRGLCLRSMGESAMGGVQGLGQMLSTIRSARLRTLDLGPSACRSTRKRLEYDSEQELAMIEAPSAAANVNAARSNPAVRTPLRDPSAALNMSVRQARRVILADLRAEEPLDPAIREQLQLPSGCVWSFDVALLYATDLEGHTTEIQPEELFARFHKF